MAWGGGGGERVTEQGDEARVGDNGKLVYNNSSVQFKTISMRSKKPKCAPPRPSEGSPSRL